MRLIDPQPKSTLPESGSVFVLWSDGTTLPFYRVQAYKRDRLLRSIRAWSYTATTEPDTEAKP
jgi:hypothetical protein